MVVKPTDFVVRGPRTRPARAEGARSRVPRISTGPEYAEPRDLERLRRRSLGPKRSLASRELAPGVEALERFLSAKSRFAACTSAVLVTSRSRASRLTRDSEGRRPWCRKQPR